MKTITIMIISLMLILPIFGSSQQTQPASPEDLATLNKIQLEHSNTRKFMSDEITRTKNTFFTDFDDRATYYEETFFSALNTAVWKLSLLFGGIIFFAMSINHILSIKLEKNKYKKLKKALKDEIGRELISSAKNQQPPTPQPRNEPVQPPPTPQYDSILTNPTPNGNIEQDRVFNPPSPPIVQQKVRKMSYFERKKQKKVMKKIQKLQKYEDDIRREKEKLALVTALGNSVGMGLPVNEQPPQQPFQPNPRQEPEQKPKVEMEYKFEVEY